MFQKSIITFAMTVVVGLFVLGGYFVNTQSHKPKDLIESRLKVKLTEESEIIDFSYEWYRVNFYAKISIPEQDVAYYQKQFSVSLNPLPDDVNIEQLPNFENTCSWWDMDKKDIVSAFETMTSGEKRFFSQAKTREIFAFISHNNQGQYFIYISY